MPDNQLLTPTKIGGKDMGKATGRQRAKMKKVMDEWKSGTLHSGSKTGPIVTEPAQAIAIGLNKSGQAKRKKKRAK